VAPSEKAKCQRFRDLVHTPRRAIRKTLSRDTLTLSRAQLDKILTAQWSPETATSDQDVEQREAIKSSRLPDKPIHPHPSHPPSKRVLDGRS